jgi:hypothetical protein
MDLNFNDSYTHLAFPNKVFRILKFNDVWALVVDKYGSQKSVDVKHLRKV